MKRMNDEYIDIHNYPERYKTMVRYLNRSPISDTNKKLIREFDDTLALIDQSGLARRIRAIDYMVVICKKYMKVDLDKATKEDVKNAVRMIDERHDYSIWTKQGYRVILKKFFKWIKFRDEYNSPENKNAYPEEVSWISCNIKPELLPKVSASDILTENEIMKMLEASSSDVQNHAIIAVLYESGCRIGEHGGVRLKHIKKEGNCYVITVKGKTGTRETFIVKMASILTSWLNAHPHRDNPDAPLWLAKNRVDPLMYRAFCILVKKIAEKAGITKRIYPHIFRHSRATHSIVHGEFTSDGAKKIFGWTPDSKMLETYLHLTSADVKDKYLEKLGLAINNNNSILDPKLCPNCRHPNLFNASICENCKTLLDSDLGIETDKRMASMRKFLLMLSQDKYIKFRLEEMAKENKDFMRVVETLGKENQV